MTRPFAALDRRRFVAGSLSAGSVLTLAGCAGDAASVTTEVTTVGNTVQSAIAAACKWEPVAAAAWGLLQSTGVVPITAIAAVQAAFAIVNAGCAIAPPLVQTLVNNVNNAVNTIMSALQGTGTTPAANTSAALKVLRSRRGDATTGASSLSVIQEAITQGLAVQQQLAPLVTKSHRHGR